MKDVASSRQEARRIVAAHLGRELVKGQNSKAEHVHHADGDPFNNDLDNLVVCNPSEHGAMHGTNRPHKARLQLALCRRRQGWGYTESDEAVLLAEAYVMADEVLEALHAKLETAIWRIERFLNYRPKSNRLWMNSKDAFFEDGKDAA